MHPVYHKVSQIYFYTLNVQGSLSFSTHKTTTRKWGLTLPCKVPFHLTHSLRPNMPMDKGKVMIFLQLTDPTTRRLTSLHVPGFLRSKGSTQVHWSWMSYLALTPHSEKEQFRKAIFLFYYNYFTILIKSYSVGKLFFDEQK